VTLATHRFFFPLCLFLDDILISIQGAEFQQ
jgi:hypothetical protein